MKSRTDWRVDLPHAFCGRADLSALTLEEWEELQWAQWRAEAAALRQAAERGPAKPEAWQLRAPATARDRYGWRGLPGTTYLGSGAQK